MAGLGTRASHECCMSSDAEEDDSGGDMHLEDQKDIFLVCVKECRKLTVMLAKDFQKERVCDTKILLYDVVLM